VSRPDETVAMLRELIGLCALVVSRKSNDRFQAKKRSLIAKPQKFKETHFSRTRLARIGITEQDVAAPDRETQKVIV